MKQTKKLNKHTITTNADGKKVKKLMKKITSVDSTVIVDLDLKDDVDDAKNGLSFSKLIKMETIDDLNE